jgi:hypothetical protein
MIFLIFIIFLILIILLVSLITYLNSKNGVNIIDETNIITKKEKIISEIKVDIDFNPTTYILLRGKGVINWGDGTIESFDNQDIATLSHNYPSSGDYILTIEGEILSCGFNGAEISFDEIPNIINYNIELINVKKLYELSIKFVSKDEGNEKYFLRGLEHCEDLMLLYISEPQNIINLPSSNKLTILSIVNNFNNYITEINNLSSQVNLESLSLVNIPTDVYKNTSNIFDTTIFNSLSQLYIIVSNGTLSNLILNNNITILNLQLLNVTNIDNLNYDNYESFFIRNVDYFNTLSELDFSNNTVITNLTYIANNSGDVNLILPIEKTTLSNLSINLENSGNNTISNVNEYTSLTSLSLKNFNTLSELDFSNNTVIESIRYIANNSGDVNLILPIEKTTLSDLFVELENSGNNTISNVNEYTSLTSLSLKNFTIPSDILDISNLDNLYGIDVSRCNLTDIALSSLISNLKDFRITFNSIQTSELNVIGQSILNQCIAYNITNGFITVTGNPGTVNLASSPWVDLIDTYFWDINV